METKRLKPLNDFAFKKVMGEKGREELLLSFLNAVLAKTGKGPLRSIEIVENRDLPAGIAGAKSVILDVRSVLADGTRADIEVQLQNQYNMDKRNLFYWSAEYTKGIEAGANFSSLRPVITINIIDFKYIRIENVFHTSYHIYEDAYKDYRLTDLLEIHYIEMPKFRNVREKDLSANPLHRWLVWLDEHSPPGLVEEVLKMDAMIQRAQTILDLIRTDPALLHSYEMYELQLMDEQSRLEGAAREALEEGLKEGLKEGKLSKAKEIAGNALAAGVAVELVSEITGLDLETLRNLGGRPAEF
ncbi:MAG: Rpn family recombination-promoting nuclease/putative transposase [Spirochaetaceae bacterium]|nr:Rpn family recombination-promoting nuclease/putative transposase [Spirochaetaceae bacterium]